MNKKLKRYLEYGRFWDIKIKTDIPIDNSVTNYSLHFHSWL